MMESDDKFMEDYEKFVMLTKWPEGTTEKQKQWIFQSLQEKAKEKTSIYVLYRPSCGCDYFESVLLDRFPMSPKIFCKCEDCGKVSLHEIVEPIEFYIPLTKQIFLLEDLRDMPIMDGPQKPYLEAYKMEAIMQFLEKKCEEEE